MSTPVFIGWLCLLFVVSFFLGSIPWGVIVSRVGYHKDIRDEGSGNIGTTNAMRTMGRFGGGLVFILDFAKGLIAGLLGFVLGNYIFTDEVNIFFSFDPVYICLALCFCGSVWGHIFSPWLKFHGGKGIAVAIGALFFVFGIWGAILELLIFIFLVVLTRYVSAGSLASAIACPFIALYLFWGHWISWILITACALTVVWAHRGNIKRLRNGTELKIGAKKGNANE
ncbi:MAG: glycerol-3-phosphate 1-O-acyltransferase PlsY [Eggerthellaceae bacterium]|nr:glycerol-3-phosphate 1-O-acyltransferase PlsY [Eggerthellaceae bacterium]